MAVEPKNGIDRVPINHLRLVVQGCIGLICVWMGINFFLFVRYLESGGTARFVERPPGAEGFLPISSLMSVYYTLRTGEVDRVHPAGVVILLLAIGMSVLVAKSFCGWICPVGFISDLLDALRKNIFKRRNGSNGKRTTTVKVVDGVMRSLKYLLLAFFVYAIVGMSTLGLHRFLHSAYNLVADVKMYYFFINLSTTAAVVIAILVILSFLIPRFWCRYLCPYGALTGIAGLLSILRIRRDKETCIDCGACRRACPSRIAVDAVEIVRSDECISCYQCVAACPVKGALELQPVTTRKSLPIRWVALIAFCLFLAGTFIAKAVGYWKNDVPVEAYIKIQESIDELGHPRSPDSLRNLDRQKAPHSP